MARKISFTKAEREAVERCADGLSLGTGEWAHTLKALQSLADKMDAASVPEERTGLDPAVLIDELKRSLGSRLALPPSPARSWWSYVGSRLKEQGVNAEHARIIAQAAPAHFRGAVTIGAVLNQIPVLLAKGGGGPVAQPQRREFTGEDDTP